MSEVVPEGWGLIPLKDVCFFQEGPGLRNWQYRDHGIKFINIRCIKDGDIDTSVAQHLSSEEVEEKYQHFLLDEGDYVLSSSGTIGRLARVKRRHLPLLLNTSVIRFRSLDDTKLDSLYLRHFLQSRQFFDKISEQSQGSAQVNFGPTHLNILDAVLPPLPEQKKIASILTSVDEVIEKTQSQIDKLQDLKKGTMNELLNKGIGHTEFKDSELGRIPKNWEVRTLSEVAKVVDCKHRTPTYREEGFPVVRPRDVKFSGIDFEQCVLVDEVDFNDLNENHKPSVGDTIYSRNATFGIGSYVKYSHDFAIGQDVCIISPKNMHPRFLNLYLNSDIVFSQVLNEMSGSTFKRINLGSIKNFKIAVPEYEEQEKLANMISAAISSIHQNEKKQQKYISLKKSLMQDLLTGKVRVSVN